MICMEAHRYALAHAPIIEPVIYRNDNTARGLGAHQHLAMLMSHRRYKDRQAGKIPQIEYVPMDQALKALE